ncbi:MAG: glycosyltransferase, partial [Thermoanaerobaculia bacterium]|nr:glycosyltransferase [Thermoanaerobaculia bacterium]
WYLESHPAAGFVGGPSVAFGAETDLSQGGFHEGDRFLRVNRARTTSMLRGEVFRAAGGFDEAIREGLEDWDFWLRCAAAGHWGGTVPEYLDWHRRRSSHADRWPDWDGGAREAAFRRELRRRYPRLFATGVPTPALRPSSPPASLADGFPAANRLVKRKRRLLFVVPWLTTGGADKFNLDAVRELTAREWEVTVVTTLGGDHSWQPEFAAATPDVFALSHFLALADVPRFLLYLVRSRGIDLVLVSNSELGYGLLPFLRASCPGVAFVDYCHNEEPQWKEGGYPALSLAARESLDLRLVASRHLAAWMAERGADRARLETVTVNVDTAFWRADPERRAATRRELEIDADLPVILFAGRLVAQKQPRVLARTLRRLARDERRFVALVAGGGPQAKALRRQLEAPELRGRVRLLGEVSTERMRGLMSASDLFFLPSKWEGISLAVYEAMAAGLAVVAADVGGQRELVTPESGVLVEPADEATEAETYARELARLLADPEARRRLGEAARTRVEREFGVERMGARLDDLLRRACESRVPSTRAVAVPAAAGAAAARAVAAAALNRGSMRLWNAAPPAPFSELDRGVRGRLFVWAYRAHQPLYEWYSRRGWRWPKPLRERVKAWLGAPS